MQPVIRAFSEQILLDNGWRMEHISAGLNGHPRVNDRQTMLSGMSVLTEYLSTSLRDSLSGSGGNELILAALASLTQNSTRRALSLFAITKLIDIMKTSQLSSHGA
jgi:hypothetical protein